MAFHFLGKADAQILCSRSPDAMLIAVGFCLEDAVDFVPTAFGPRANGAWLETTVGREWITDLRFDSQIRSI